MAIAFDNSGQNRAIGTTTNSVTHTCTGANGVLFAWINIEAVTADDVSTVTYGPSGTGQSMTQISKFQTLGGTFQYVYMLVAPDTTAGNSVKATFSVSLNTDIITYSVTGANQSLAYSGGGQTDNVATRAAVLNETSAVQSVTTLADNSWAVFGVWMNSNTTNTRTGDSFTTFVQTITTGARQFAIWDNSSHGAITPAGSYTMTVNTTGGADTVIAGGSTIWSISPVPVPPATTIHSLTLLGTGI